MRILSTPGLVDTTEFSLNRKFFTVVIPRRGVLPHSRCVPDISKQNELL